MFLQPKSYDCWGRAALIIGSVLSGYDRISRSLPKGTGIIRNELVRESLGNALKPCSIDDALLDAGGRVKEEVLDALTTRPSSIHELSGAFANYYREVSNEVV